MLERLRGAWASINAQPVAVKVVLIIVAFTLLVLLSRVLAILAGLVLLVSLAAMVIRLFRRRPLRGWGIVALASLVSIFAFTGIANAVYGPPEQPPRQQAATDAPVEEPTTSAEAKEDETVQAKEATEEATSEAETSTDTASETASTPPEPEDEEAENEGYRGGGYDATVTVARVVDGDTIEVSPAVDGIEEVRLIGVDTPETKDLDCAVQPYGPEASEFATSELQGEEVDLEFDEEREDRYGRLLAYVYKDGDMFNEALLEEGYAQVYIVDPNDEYEDRFEEAQKEAQAAERGIWELSAAEQAQLADRDNGIGSDECQPKATPPPPPPPPPAPSPTPTPDIPSAPSAPGPPAGRSGLTCADFSSEAEASAAIPSNPQLDRDGDGRACESLP